MNNAEQIQIEANIKAAHEYADRLFDRGLQAMREAGDISGSPNEREQSDLDMFRRMTGFAAEALAREGVIVENRPHLLIAQVFLDRAEQLSREAKVEKKRLVEVKGDSDLSRTEGLAHLDEDFRAEVKYAHRTWKILQAGAVALVEDTWGDDES